MSSLPRLRSRPPWERIVPAAVILALGPACRTAPPEPDATRTTDAGRFVVTLRSATEPIPLNAIHSWLLHVSLADGTPVAGATITLQGGMPAHAHGLPTTPEIVPGATPGDYRIEGMKFSMPGHWTLTPTIWADGVRDAATFDVDLP